MTTLQVDIEQLRYPIGKFSAPQGFMDSDIRKWIQTIEDFPARLRIEVDTLSDLQLDTPYREDGWTIRQVVHHLADSHLNSYMRFKLALTEDNPTIKPYFEDRWAELPEAKQAPVNISITLLHGLHQRWALMLHNMTTDDFRRTFFHPEYKTKRSLFETLALYDWHCRHHLAHITSLKRRMGW